MLLVPGDSPVGFRLPIASLPWIPPAVYPHVIPRDPMEALGPLPPPDPARQPYLTGAARGPDWQARVTQNEQQTPVEG